LFDNNRTDSGSNTTTLAELQTAGGEAQPQESASDEKTPSPTSDDFASALENFTSEMEESVAEDHVLKGRVLKLTPTHVVVDIGAKSEGMLALSEVLDPQGNPRFEPGQEIDVVRERGRPKKATSSSRSRRRSACWPGIRLRRLTARISPFKPPSSSARKAA
jgi:hypothetical protein